MTEGNKPNSQGEVCGQATLFVGGQALELRTTVRKRFRRCDDERR